MAAEAVTKKRGRPKKVDVLAASSATSGDATATRSSSTEQKSRAFSTTEAAADSVTTKKVTRRTKVAAVVDVPLQKEALKEAPSLNAKPAKRAPKTKAATSARASASHVVMLQPSEPSVELSTASSARAPATVMPETLSTDSPPIDSPFVNSSPPESHSAQPKTTSTQSSFLSTFLSDTTTDSPIITEASRFSDWSAFSAPKPSADEIVSGVGVSDMSAFPAPASKPTATKQSKQRESAIPIRQPKSFKGHSLTAFPNRPDVSPKQLRMQVQPEKYGVGAFSAFRVAPGPSSTQAEGRSNGKSAGGSTAQGSTVRSSPSVPPSTNFSSTSSPIAQQAIVALQTSSKPSPGTTSNTSTTPSPSGSTNHPSQPTCSTPPSPHLFSTPSHLQTSTITSKYPQMPKPTGTAFRPKSPTEMSHKELLSNNDFRRLRRRWTSLIVGIPVLVVTSYVLWERLELGKDSVGFGGWGAGGNSGTGEGAVREDGRVRGIMPVATDGDGRNGEKRLLDEK